MAQKFGRVNFLTNLMCAVVFITVLEYYRDPRNHLLVTLDMTTRRIFNLIIPVSACIIIIIIIDITYQRDEQQYLYVYLTRIRFFISIVYSTFFIFLPFFLITLSIIALYIKGQLLRLLQPRVHHLLLFGLFLHPLPSHGGPLLEYL